MGLVPELGCMLLAVLVRVRFRLCTVLVLAPGRAASLSACLLVVRSSCVLVVQPGVCGHVPVRMHTNYYASSLKLRIWHF